MVETELLFMNMSAVDRIGGSVILTLQCASAVYHTSGTRLGTGGFSGEYIWTEDSSLRRSGALSPASLSAKTKMKSDGATVALWWRVAVTLEAADTSEVGARSAWRSPRSDIQTRTAVCQFTWGVAESDVEVMKL